MLYLIKQVFIVLLSFSNSLAWIVKISNKTKNVLLNYEPWMIRSSLIDLSPVELKYYAFMISLNKFSGSHNVL